VSLNHAFVTVKGAELTTGNIIAIR
jgi:hypothetical protein